MVMMMVPITTPITIMMAGSIEVVSSCRFLSISS